MSAESPVSETSMNIIDIGSVESSFYISSRGSKVLRLNGYDYHKQKQKNNSVHYTCMDKRIWSCKARATTDLDGNLKSIGPNDHNHTQRDLQDKIIRKKSSPGSSTTPRRTSPNKEGARRSVGRPRKVEETEDLDDNYEESLEFSTIPDALNDCTNCRFCLKPFLPDERSLDINSSIRLQYFIITDSDLNPSEDLSQVICESCYKLSCELATYKTELLRNQRRLEDTLYNHDTSLSFACSPKVEMNIKDEPYEDPVDDTNEIFLVSGYTEEFIEDSSIVSTSQEPIKVVKRQRKPKDPKEPKEKLCADCGKTFSSKRQYKLHYDRVHLKIKRFQCDYCGYRTNCKNTLKIHIHSHLKIKTHYCDQCGMGFGSRNILRNHLLTHDAYRVMPFKCQYEDCIRSFANIHLLRRHFETHANNKRVFANPHPCEICKKVFGRQKDLNRHLIYHQEPTLQCDICSRKFYREPELQAHRKMHWGQRDFNCTVCSKSYFNKTNLNRHMKIHTVG